MKKALLIISILSIIFLTGCGVFNLNGWVWPEVTDFITTIEGLKTLQEIANYMQDNFTYEKHNLWTPDPYALWKTGKGDCNDFATFGIFVADYHGYETYQIIISYSNSTKHMIAVYVEDNGFSFSDNRIHSFYLKKTYFDTFEEIVDFDCEYYPDKEFKGYIVKDYENNLIEEVYKDVYQEYIYSYKNSSDIDFRCRIISLFKKEIK